MSPGSFRSSNLLLVPRLPRSPSATDSTNIQQPATAKRFPQVPSQYKYLGIRQRMYAASPRPSAEIRPWRDAARCKHFYDAIVVRELSRAQVGTGICFEEGLVNMSEFNDRSSRRVLLSRVGMAGIAIGLLVPGFGLSSSAVKADGEVPKVVLDWVGAWETNDAPNKIAGLYGVNGTYADISANANLQGADIKTFV